METVASTPAGDLELR